MHLNINSLQNKQEELNILIENFKAHVIFLLETKIDTSYPNKQFKFDGYNMYRKDCVKGGGGVMAYFFFESANEKVDITLKIFFF